MLTIGIGDVVTHVEKCGEYQVEDIAGKKVLVRTTESFAGGIPWWCNIAFLTKRGQES